jgi:quercetin 2,3-dioxygenase
MKTTIHLADDRFAADHGWLKTRHTFSFAGQYDPNRVHFGALRVLNDDMITGGMGFGMHPHDNMEIVTIPLTGALKHKDSMGNQAIIKAGEVQIMSAGTGIFHSEHNAHTDEHINLLQIWVFPKEKDIQPRYDQKEYSPDDRQNKWQFVVAPDMPGEALWINQKAWFALQDADAGKHTTYVKQQADSGVYVFVISGNIRIGDILLGDRDGMGIEDTRNIEISIEKNSRILVMEVPMQW